MSVRYTEFTFDDTGAFVYVLHQIRYFLSALFSEQQIFL